MSSVFSIQSSGSINQNPLKVDRIALVDADYMKYIFSSRMKKKLEEFQSFSYSSRQSLIPEIRDQVIFELTHKIADPMLFCFSGKSYNTFRYSLTITKEYKGSRTKDEPYEGATNDVTEFVEYVIKRYNSLIFSDLEADDILSALQDSENTYLVTKDKDLKQVPGMHYNWASNTIYEISKVEALYHLAYQTIAGDSTDDISGIEGMGPKKSSDYLSTIQRPQDYMLAALSLYQQKYGFFQGVEKFSETIQLVMMRTGQGAWFQKKYMQMFDMKKRLLLEIQKRKLESL